MIELYCGDCLEVMKSIRDNSVDAIITDPPYGTTACKWDSVIDFNLMWEQLNRIIKENGAIVLFGSEPFSSALRLSNIKNYKYDWIWHKNTSGGFALAKKMPMKYHEILSVFYNKQPTYNPQFQNYSKSTNKRYKNGEIVNRKKETINPTNKIQGGLGLKGIQVIDKKRGKYPESVQRFNSYSNNKRFHSTQKPVALMEYLIKTYTNENETVLDFTMGSGTTGVACKNLNRNFIGIEKDKKYFDIASKRIKEHQPQLSLI